MSVAQLQAGIDRVTADVPKLFGKRLVCLALYGSAVDASFIPERSDINFAIVLDEIELPNLKRLQPALPDWHRLGVATPLLIDLAFLEHARDVFPIELTDIQARHRLLAGRDVFAPLIIDAGDLRRQLEQEVRSKLLRLRVRYAETAGRREDVEALLVDSVNTFIVIIRGVMQLESLSPPGDPLELLTSFEARGRARFAGIRRILTVRLGKTKSLENTEDAFAEYLADVERLTRLVDALYRPTPSDGER